mgnify:CR=1 FL=1
MSLPLQTSGSATDGIHRNFHSNTGAFSSLTLNLQSGIFFIQEMQAAVQIGETNFSGITGVKIVLEFSLHLLKLILRNSAAII